jgi:urease accessory protein
VHSGIDASDRWSARQTRSGFAAVPQRLRSNGRIDAAFRNREGRTAVVRAFQSGCLRVRVPRGEPDDGGLCAVVMNTAGGLAEGDRLEQSFAWGEGAVATVTTQAAEKIYRALAEGADVSTRLTVSRGANAEWLPQETILFDAARLRRDTQIVLAEDVTFLGVEAVVLGRAAMGETVRSGSLDDRLRIWRNGRLIYADALALDGDIAALMQRAGVADGARSFAVLVHASAAAAGLLAPVRAALGQARGMAAASCWNGLLAVRFLAPDGESLRHDLAVALATVRGGRPLPRVWCC